MKAGNETEIKMRTHKCYALLNDRVLWDLFCWFFDAHFCSALAARHNGIVHKLADGGCRFVIQAHTHTHTSHTLDYEWLTGIPCLY